MTKKGWASVLVRREVADTIKDLAEKNGKSRVEMVSDIVKEYLERHQGEIADGPQG